MRPSRRTQAWRALLLTADVALTVALIIPATVVRLGLSVSAFALHILRHLMPSPISQLLDHLLHLLLPSPSPTPSSTSPLTSHFPPILLRRHFVTVGSELRTTELLSIPPLHPPSNLPSSSPLHFLLCTGNPGTAHYYTTFLSTLHTLSAHSLHIDCLSFAGHQSAQTLHLHRHRRLYDLHDQTDLWRAFLTSLHAQYPHHRFILAGHSIGAWIALQCSSALPPSQLLHTFLLFPTLSDMAKTPNGRRLRWLFAYGQSIAAALAWAASLVPSRLLLPLMLRVLPPTDSATPSQEVERLDVALTTLDLLHPSVVRQALGLAASELREVREVDARMMGVVKEGKATFVFGVNDGWNPAWQQDQLRWAYPKAKVKRMERGVPHAFVVGSQRVAEEVWADISRMKADWDKQEQSPAVYPS